jgi:hypothetical protein
MSSPPIRYAATTGRVWSHDWGTLIEVICPQCGFTTFYVPGIANCCLCDRRFKVAMLSAVPKPAPVSPPDTSEEHPHAETTEE